MNHVYPGNPYQAPNASIALRDEIRRPPVHTAIAWFSGALGVCHSLSIVGFVLVLAGAIGRLGWRKALLYTAWPDPRSLLFLGASILGAATYFASGRLLWNRRGRPGLILCGTGIGLTYLAVWLLRPK